MESALSKGGVAMNRKTIKISEKRQITIPQKYYEKLGFTNEAECLMRGNEIVLRPVKTVSGGEFAEQILADLIAKGLSNDELLAAFKAEQKKFGRLWRPCWPMRKMPQRVAVSIPLMMMYLARGSEYGRSQVPSSCSQVSKEAQG